MRFRQRAVELQKKCTKTFIEISHWPFLDFTEACRHLPCRNQPEPESEVIVAKGVSY